MQNEGIEQFLLWLNEEEEKAPDLKGCGEFETIWYAIGYQDALQKILSNYRLAFKDEL
jgi:hypothetical protein